MSLQRASACDRDLHRELATPTSKSQVAIRQATVPEAYRKGEKEPGPPVDEMAHFGRIQLTRHQYHKLVELWS
jgi:hypothetical protein